MDTLNYSSATLERIRQIVAAVKGVDLGDHAAEDELELDSISRITLIAELENHFNLELGDGDVVPEVFECLASLAKMIEAKLV